MNIKEIIKLLQSLRFDIYDGKSRDFVIEKLNTSISNLIGLEYAPPSVWEQEKQSSLATDTVMNCIPEDRDGNLP